MHNVHVIDPVTRIEGHAKITLHLDDDGGVSDARFHVTEFRGFEDFCVGRPYHEMPALTARTCGICPVSHLLASAKAGDEILAVRIPEAADRQRRLANMGQIIQSHALSFFHLSAPDLMLGMDSDPAQRNVFGLVATEPELARRGIRLRKFGQEILEVVTGRRIHGPWVVAGGAGQQMTSEDVETIRGTLDEAHDAAVRTLEEFTAILDRFGREIDAFGDFPSLFLGHCQPDGTWEHYSGGLRIVDAGGEIVADQLAPAAYREYLGEAANVDSYLKSPYYKPYVGDDGVAMDGIYRVGPLARLNISEQMGTPKADAALATFRERTGGRVATSSFHYHYARLIEVLACTERIADLLDDPMLTDYHIRAEGGVNRQRGVGASEAPRGTLFHDYEVDDHGIITGVNLVIATGNNNLAMNRTITQIAQEYVEGPELPDGVLNRIEAGIRAYDPCLSCSTHAIGQMPMVVELHGPDGEVLCEARRDAPAVE